MSNYTITTDFGAKDSLPSSNSAKVVRGSEFTTEFTNIQTAIATKADTAGDTFTGAVTFDAAVTLNSTATITGDLTVDTDTLFVDVSADKVGIGTTSPASTLHVQASANALQLNNANEDTYMKVCGDRAQFGYRASDGYAIVQGGSTKGIAFGVNNATFGSGEVMRIDSSGNVGIGTNNPSNQFHLKSAGANFATMRLDASGNTAPANFLIRSHDGAFDIRDATNSGTRLTIDSSGNVGIGATSPTDKLDVAGAIRADDIIHVNSTNYARLEIGGDTGAYIDLKTPSSDDFDFRMIHDSAGSKLISPSSDLHFDIGGQLRTIIKSDGNVGIGTSSPDNVGSATTLHINDNTNGGAIRLSEGGTNNAFVSYDHPTGMRIQSIDTITLKTNNADRLHIKSDGNVGIGTSSPSTTLHVQRNGTKVDVDASTAATFQSTGATGSSTFVSILAGSTGSTGQAAINFGDADDQDIGRILYRNADNSMAFTTNNAEAMRIDSSGDLMVGTTDENAYNGGFSVKTGTVPYINVGHASSVASGNYYAAFRHGTNTLGTITQNGTTGVLYNTSSDERLKENIADSADAGSKVDAIQIRQFDWIADGSHQDYGVIAQELVTVAPEAVHQPEDSEEMMGVDYSKLVPMLIKEVQSLRSRVAELENA